MNINDLEQILLESLQGRPTSNAVVHPSPIPSGFHQPNPSQFAQMPGDFILRDSEGVHQLADAQLFLEEQADQPKAGRISQGRQERDDVLCLDGIN